MSSDIVVGPAGGVLEARMQLDLPGQKPRLIKCLAGSSLLDVKNALVAIGTMSANQHLAKVEPPGCPASILTLDVPVASLNRFTLQIASSAPVAAAASHPEVAVGGGGASSHGKSSPPPELNPHVGINAAELEKRRLQMIADMQKKEDEQKRILIAAEQEQKDRALEKQMKQAKIAADEQKKRNAMELSGAPQDRITLGSASTGALVARIKVQTKSGAVEVHCYDADATFGILRMMLVNKNLCSEDTPIVQAMEQ
jgi:hypothetical protein